MLQRRGRVTYGALKLQFHLDDDQLTILKDDLLYAYAQVVDDEGRGLIWTGAPSTEPAAVFPPRSLLGGHHSRTRPPIWPRRS